MPLFNPEATTLSIAGGTVTADQGLPGTAVNAWFTKLVDSAGVNVAEVQSSGAVKTNPSAFLANGQRVMLTSYPVCIASDQSAFPVNQGTSPWVVSASSWPLGTGAATEATLATMLTLAGFQARVNTLGQKTSANSTPVVLSSDYTVPVSSATLATEATLGTLLLNSTFTGRTPSALVGGRFDTNLGSWLGSTAPTVGSKTSANSVPVVVASDQGAVSVSGTVTANIGTSGSLALDATLTGGTQKAIVRGGAKGATVAADVTSTANGVDHQALDVSVNGTATVSGTVTANAGTNLNTSALALDATLAKLTIAQGTALGSNTLALPGGSVLTAAPSYTTGQISPFSLTVGGGLRSDMASIAGTATATGNGVSTAGVQRVAVVSDNTAFSVNANAGTNLNTSSLALDATLTTRLPSALVGGRLDINSGAWLGSTAPTVGQKATANSIPVTFPSDPSTLPISAASLPLPSGASTDAVLTGGTTKAIARGGAKGTTTASDITSTANGADHQGLDVQVQGTVPISGTIAATQSTSPWAVGGTVTSDQGVANSTPWSVSSFLSSGGTTTQMRGFDVDTGVGAQQVAGANLRISASGGSIEAKGQQLLASSIPVALASDQGLLVAQSAITSGQIGPMIQASVVKDSTPPSYSNGNTNPICINEKGSLKVQLYSNDGKTGADVSSSGVFVDQKTWLGSTAPTVGQKAMASSVPVVLASDQTAVPFSVSQKTTYSSSIIGLALAVAATDVFVITGSGTKTVKVTALRITGTATAAGAVDVQLVKRSTANSGGTSTSPAVVSHDSNDAVGTATAKAYTVNPTTGTLVGSVRSEKLFVPAVAGVAFAPMPLDYDFVHDPAKAMVLRGTGESLAVNLNAGTVTGGLLNIFTEWTEE